MLRFAPSPTKDININDLRVAIFNLILSKQLKEPLLIRIEDLDKEKNIEGKEKDILELLSLFSIEHSHVVYQSESLKYHQKLAMQLMAKKQAFSCFCGEGKLNELKEEADKNGHSFRYDGFCETLSDETVLNVNSPFTVRIKKPESNIKFIDELKGEFDNAPADIDSFVILNHDKTPTYDYACSVDDMINNISTVIRSDNYISNTAKQIHIRKSLNYDVEIKYIHLTNIDIDADTSIKSLIEEGFLPSAIANYLVLIGNKTPKEIFTLEEAIEWFDIKNITNEVTKFNIDKLKLINKKHLENMDDMRFSKILGFADTDIGKLGKLFLEEFSTIKEIKSKINIIFSSKKPSLGFEKEFTVLQNCLSNAPFFDDYKDLEIYLAKETGLKEESLLNPLKHILTGQNDGPDISDIYPLIKNYLGEIIK